MASAGTAVLMVCASEFSWRDDTINLYAMQVFSILLLRVIMHGNKS